VPAVTTSRDHAGATSSKPRASLQSLTALAVVVARERIVLGPEEKGHAVGRDRASQIDEPDIVSDVVVAGSEHGEANGSLARS
jgi:hypothetical protein